MIAWKTLLQAFGLISVSSRVAAGPCDLYASGNTPCVAAHSTTRALYSSYNGPLYQVQRASDGKVMDIRTLYAGGYANSGSQDSFCSGTTCYITIVYDQSPNGNKLTRAPPGQAASGPGPNGFDNLAVATDAPAMLNGHKVYGIYINPGTGYRNDQTRGVATGDQPEGIYAVLDGTHYNNGCCFDYGNAETDNNDDGAGAMEALYFGSRSLKSSGAGSGPWVMADLENGLFSGQQFGKNTADLSLPYRFVTAILKGGPNNWALRGGNAASGSLTTFYHGPRPAGYNPLRKQGAIILGIGGDNSDWGAGTFYEGAITSGYPLATADNAVQANIVAAKYTT